MTHVVKVVGAAIASGGRCLVAQRGPAMSHPGKWEFPGGKVEPGEAPEAALAREIREELGVAITIERWLGQGECRSERRTILLDVYATTLASGEPRAREHAELRWVAPDELATLDWSEADLPLIDVVSRWLRGTR